MSSYFSFITSLLKKPERTEVNESNILDEQRIIDLYLSRFTKEYQPIMIQVGANEGRFEYAKKDEKDFVFEFLLRNSHWEAILVEPFPEAFKQLKLNYKKHRNRLYFINCAITERIEKKTLYVIGRDGKSSTLSVSCESKNKKITTQISVSCIPYEYLCEILGLERVDFIKIDAEGYDEIIVRSILSSDKKEIVPRIIFWESLGVNNHKKEIFEEFVSNCDYDIFLTGLNKNDKYMDRVAIHRSLR